MSTSDCIYADPSKAGKRSDPFITIAELERHHPEIFMVQGLGHLRRTMLEHYDHFWEDDSNPRLEPF